jgi:predicted  nucleic acid-binding Zn-ribbon protein
MTTVLVELQELRDERDELTMKHVELRERNAALEAQLDHVVKSYTEKVFKLKTRVAELESTLEEYRG